MLQPVIEKISAKRIILASGSPRRKEILEKVGFPFEIIPSTFEENLDKGEFSHPNEYVVETAKQKAIEVAKRLVKDTRQPDIIIGADTVVTMDGSIFEKPKDEEDAFRMLSRLSGKVHKVFTGVCLLQYNNGFACRDLSDEKRFRITQFYETTEVKFASITAETIKHYIDTREPMDKAGGYGIQATGSTLIEGVNGDYFNVMGFPIHKFAIHLLSIISGEH